MDRLSAPDSSDLINYTAAQDEVRFQEGHGPARYRLSIWPKGKTWNDDPTWNLTFVEVRQDGGSAGDAVWYVCEDQDIFGSVEFCGKGEYCDYDDIDDIMGFLRLQSSGGKVLISQPVWELHK
jgi:hypothetical protein